VVLVAEFRVAGNADDAGTPPIGGAGRDTHRATKGLQPPLGSDSAQPRAFVQEGSVRVTERAGRTGSARTLAFRFVDGPTGLLNQDSGGAGANTRWYQTNGLGSVWALTGPTATPTDKYAYNAYGETIYHTGTTENHARFVGGEGYFDDLNGLRLLGHRYYDPQLKRFLTQDPIGLAGGDLNFYAYCGNNPLTRIDPDGLALEIVDPEDPNAPTEGERRVIETCIRMINEMVFERHCFANDPDLHAKVSAYLLDNPVEGEEGDDLWIRVGRPSNDIIRFGDWLSDLFTDSFRWAYTVRGASRNYLVVMDITFGDRRAPTVLYAILHEVLEKALGDHAKAIEVGDRVLPGQGMKSDKEEKRKEKEREKARKEREKERKRGKQ
jgi:RHS repeat-associated protein